MNFLESQLEAKEISIYLSKLRKTLDLALESAYTGNIEGLNLMTELNRQMIESIEASPKLPIINKMLVWLNDKEGLKNAHIQSQLNILTNVKLENVVTFRETFLGFKMLQLLLQHPTKNLNTKRQLQEFQFEYSTKVELLNHFLPLDLFPSPRSNQKH
ncbi:MAG: hypothetical protein AB8E15_08115 [Bdellovibrionales bacterium]